MRWRQLSSLLVAVLAGTGLTVPAAAATPPTSAVVAPSAAGRVPTLGDLAAASAASVVPAAASTATPAGPEDVSFDEVPVVVPPTSDQVAPTEPADPPADVPADEITAADPLVAAEPVADGRVTTPPVETDDAQTVGITWPAGAEGTELAPQVRTRTDGEWSPWLELPASDVAPDAGTADADHQGQRGGTDPLWIGDADAVQLSFDAADAGGPDDVRLALVGSPETAAPASGTARGGAGGRLGASVASVLPAVDADAVVLPAAAPQPRIISRAEWGARAPVCKPDVASTLRGAVVHHTAGSNSYGSVAQAMQQIRNDQAYHIDARGWCDIGYNFIVDKWGNTYEAREGSLLEPVIGVHAGGFNTGTVGVSMLGTYDAAPPAATVDAVGKIIGFLLGSYGVDPQGWMSYYTGAGENSRFSNQTVTLPVVFGHRDVAFTSCPGNGGYAALASIRAIAAANLGAAGGLVRTSADPTVYLVSGDRKYPVPDLGTLTALAPLGGVRFVSAEFLAARATGRALDRFFRGADGTIYLYDRGVRYPVASCDDLAAYGPSCAEFGGVALTNAQINAFRLGPTLGRTVVTTNGKKFAVEAGKRREVGTGSAFVGAGLPVPGIALDEETIGRMPYGAPILDPVTSLVDRSTMQRWMGAGGKRWATAPGVLEESALGALETSMLDTQSLAQLPLAGNTPIQGVVTTQGRRAVLTHAGLRTLAAGELTTVAAVAVPDVVGAALPAVGGATLFVKEVGTAPVYVLDRGAARWVPDGSVAGALLLGARLDFAVLGNAAMATVPRGFDVLRPGSVVKSPSSPDLFLVDGVSQLAKVTSMDTLGAYGAGWGVVDAAVLAAYRQGAPLSPSFSCGGSPGIAVGGEAWWVQGSAGLPTRALEASTCSTLPWRGTLPGTLLLKASGSPDVYAAWGGTRRPVTSMTTVFALAGAGPLRIATLEPSEVAALRVGPAVLQPGTVVHKAGSPDLFLVDGASMLRRVQSMDQLGRYGRGWSTVDPAALTGYAVGEPLTTAVACGGAGLLARGGRLQQVADGFGLGFPPLDASTCAALPWASGMHDGRVLVKGVGSPTVYLMESGTRRPIATMATVLFFNGPRPLTIFTLEDAEIATIPVGPGV